MDGRDDDDDRPPTDPAAGRRPGIRIRSLMMGVGLAAFALALARDSFPLWVAVLLLGGLAAALAMLGLGMAAGFVGLWLFGMLDRPSERGKPAATGAWDDRDEFRPT